MSEVPSPTNLNSRQRTGLDEPPLSRAEVTSLHRYEEIIDRSVRAVQESFTEMALAFFQIREQRLYRATHASFAAYFRAKWAYGRSHSNRIADAGMILDRLSPQGGIVKSMTSEAHFRPLLSLDEPDQEAVLSLAEQWSQWRRDAPVEPALLRSARSFVKPPIEPSAPDESQQGMLRQIAAIVDDAQGQLPKGTSAEIQKVFGQMKKKVAALAKPRSSTGIAWTSATWNPLQGCARVSPGCDRCYAAKLIATRMADMYPGLASIKTGKDGTKSYFFLNKIILLPEDLGQPLQDRSPKRYFVNSMSDLFHQKVPDDFIAAVFEVMKKAHWHQFQVLTKRPERMAAFTSEYFKKEEPPANVWLGTSTENQAAFDERIPWLRKTIAAVRWLSCEPLLGPIVFDSPRQIDWVVVGGESDSHRKMEKAWATSLRDQCRKAKIPFFFKQWGSFDESGHGPAKEKHDKLTPPPIDGEIHNAYPEST